VNYFKKKLYEKGALDLFVKDAFSVEMEISAARNFVKKCSEKDAGEILKKLLSRGFSPEAAFAVLKEFKKGEILENRSDF
jgi:rRNA processing protein Krr1/Pno1